jgi:hypothetical protein
MITPMQAQLATTALVGRGYHKDSATLFIVKSRNIGVCPVRGNGDRNAEPPAHEYFRPADRTKMFHVKHFGTIGGIKSAPGARDGNQSGPGDGNLAPRFEQLPEAKPEPQCK